MLQRKKKAWQLSDQYVLLEQGVVNEVDSVYCSEMTRKQTGLCVGFCLKVPTVILGTGLPSKLCATTSLMVAG